MSLNLYLLLIVFLINFFNLAHACSPAFGEKASTIAQKSQRADYVFDGTVTEITPSYFKIKVAQYFKGEGAGDLKITRQPETSCSDQLEANQRLLFFTEGDTTNALKFVYDGNFGSSRSMNEQTFQEVTAAKTCMANYQEGILNVPCVVHESPQKFYSARLRILPDPTKQLNFLLTNLSDNTKIKTECLATYRSGKLSIPCISHRGSQKVYSAVLTFSNKDNKPTFLLKSSAVVSNLINQVIGAENFDRTKTGALPDQWMVGVTGEGDYTWQVKNDASAPSIPSVMAITGTGDYSWAVKKDTQITDGFVATKFKAISGDIDQAAGLVWRWKDANNYYVARANALEDNVSIYYVEDGVRNTLLYQDLPNGQRIKQKVWRNLRVDFKGDTFKVSYEGVVIFETKDQVIEGAGAVGLWVKQDSQISFDDFSYGRNE